MLSKQVLLLFTLFLSALAINYDAYDGGSFNRKKTSNANYNLQVYAASDSSSCWFANKKIFKDGTYPACCLKLGNAIATQYKNGGDIFTECVSANKGVLIYDVLFDLEQDEGLVQWHCRKQVRNLGRNISGVRAHCNNWGCLTRYGWLDNGNFRKVKC
ncbi:hypothetical protein PIROE2DRAFT_11773 [Piromyces sp. E2]|nr:hypothetical protein PIROE2DRAFT_11773 [Piromyces sp. E2]|eukprot:OUM62065.1 hypothetical protein PIROE2DRAFT_11773 [Piromyces sp. E2]